jgi:SAM-dependent methyltransferase
MLEDILKTISINKLGVEIGGASGSGKTIYEHARNIDNVVFANDTIWSKHTDEYKFYPGKVGKTIINDAVNIDKVLDKTYDFCFASHSLEHIANPIKALKEWLRIIKDNGHIALVLPEKSLCFDWKRKYTTFDRLKEQYDKNKGEDDLSTLPEILLNHDLSKDLPAGTFLQFRKRSQKNFDNRCLHHFVYSPELLKELCNYLKCEFVYTETRGIDIWFIMKKVIPKKQVGYIHICQIKGWQRSFDLIYDKLISSGLYDATDEIRIGIVNQDGKVIPDERLNNSKFNIVYVGRCMEFERPTILHMRKQAEFEVCNYWYLHTKGLRHFDTEREKNILCWIDILLYFNVTKWRDAVLKLKTYDTYSCLLLNAESGGCFPTHYSGNFWWTTSKYIVTLPYKINPDYIAPETYILTGNPKIFNAYSHKYLSNYFVDLKPEEYNTLEVKDNIISNKKEMIYNILPIDLTPPHLKNNRDAIFPLLSKTGKLVETSEPEPESKPEPVVQYKSNHKISLFKRR